MIIHDDVCFVWLKRSKLLVNFVCHTDRSDCSMGEQLTLKLNKLKVLISDEMGMSHLMKLLKLEKSIYK